MNKFHQIPTDTFVPVSHDNSYLFNHYDKVANFLAFNLEKNYKNILAKPIQNAYMFDWFSTYENLININEKSKVEAEEQLIKYWEFLEVINAKIKQLSASNEENNINWANLLKKVFNHTDNFIFSNGKDICIVWGWKFDNSKNYKPNIVIDPSKKDEIQINYPIYNPDSITEDSIISEDSPEDLEIQEFIEEEVNTFEDVIVEDIIETEKEEESSFLNFLKWFASNYWWLLLVLAALIILVFVYKTIIYNAI
ncbi:hypothetical protein FLGE108171_14650 [Flavobacterium gelidilacus]|uniref:hypothetical protein n=1 Tax=Flavobacterium gelidilacus TaxID=206041 RepID=UPI00041D0280|nr:hypothetical protein [Flavobacterium gelidilacus]